MEVRGKSSRGERSEKKTKVYGLKKEKRTPRHSSMSVRKGKGSIVGSSRRKKKKK